ncbi:MAG: acyltransferase family protein, partial [Clostridium sp.]|nr:acyltransferase family protein [Clostridium sp.]
MNESNLKKHITSYDGLRSIALLGIIFYHLMPDTLPGGFLGVVIFFVMAGYLTMRKTISFNNNKKPSPITQLLKRFKKLLPPLIFMVMIIVIIMAAFYPQFLKSLRWQAIGSIFGFNNIA